MGGSSRGFGQLASEDAFCAFLFPEGESLLDAGSTTMELLRFGTLGFLSCHVFRKSGGSRAGSQCHRLGQADSFFSVLFFFFSTSFGRHAVSLPLLGPMPFFPRLDCRSWRASGSLFSGRFHLFFFFLNSKEKTPSSKGNQPVEACLACMLVTRRPVHDFIRTGGGFVCRRGGPRPCSNHSVFKSASRALALCQSKQGSRSPL